MTQLCKKVFKKNKIKKEEEIEDFKCHHPIKYFSVKCKEINFRVNIIYEAK